MSSSNRGFTLIEIMIVVAMIAAVLAIGGPRLIDAKNEMRRAVRELGIVPRSIRDNARLFNMTGRLVIQMDKEKGHAFWVESTTGSVVLLSESQEQELDKLTEIQRNDLAKKNSFKPDPRIMKKPRQLPRGMIFESVEYATRKDPVTTGQAFIHFFPSGLVEEAAIHMTDSKKLNWTVLIEPLTGRVQVYERNIPLKEFETQ